MAFAVPLGYGVARGLENHAANRSRRHRQKDNGCGVICNHVVDAAHGARRGEIIRQSEYKKIESTSGQDQKAGKDAEMKSPSDPVARMLPLPQPELQYFLQAQQRPVKTKIALAVNQRRHALDHDVCEACEPEKLDKQEQDL